MDDTYRCSLYPLGRILRERREKRAISQREVSGGICSLQEYEAFETNRAYPNDIELAYLCKRLGLSFGASEAAISMHQMMMNSLDVLAERAPELSQQFREHMEREEEMYELTEWIIRVVSELKEAGPLSGRL